jgi:hypothetical protein
MTTTPPRVKARRTMAHSLKSVYHVGIEMARTYRAVKRGDIDSSDGYRRVMMLSALKQCLESSEFERRLAEMEAAVNKQSDVAKFTPRIVG